MIVSICPSGSKRVCFPLPYPDENHRTALNLITFIIFREYLISICNINQWPERQVWHCQWMSHSQDISVSYATVPLFLMDLLRVEVANMSANATATVLTAFEWVPHCYLRKCWVICIRGWQQKHFHQLLSCLSSVLPHFSLLWLYTSLPPGSPVPRFLAKSSASGVSLFPVLIAAPFAISLMTR